VDDLNGTVHRAYGEMPNMVYIVDKQGKIVYTAKWTDHAEIETVLENLVMAEEMAAQGVQVRPSYTEMLSFVVGYGQEVREKGVEPGRSQGEARAADRIRRLTRRGQVIMHVLSASVSTSDRGKSRNTSIEYR
jgi:hypothetical protein